MGFSQSWLAVKGKAATVLLEEMRLKVDTSGHAPTPVIYGGQLTSGWHVIFSPDFGLKIFNEESVQRLSTGCDLVRGSVNEVDGVSAAEEWKDGVHLWSIVHDVAEGGDEHLEITGTPRPILASIRQKSEAAQAAEPWPGDYMFDVPVQVAEALTGYHPDKTLADVKFERLTDRSWTNILFKPISKLFKVQRTPSRR